MNPRSIGSAFNLAGLDLVRIATTHVPVSLMGLFEVGDIWHGGSLAGRMEFTQRRLTFTYHPERLGFVDAGLSRDDGVRWLVPVDEYPLGALLPNAQLATISDGKYPYRYLVPCACLLSFYYGGSSELYRAVFRPGFGQPNNPAFDSGLTHRQGSSLHLHLAQGIPVEDARVIAAWTTDYGLAQVARVYESLLVPRNGAPGYLRVLPPFHGTEHLHAEGIHLGIGTPYERFLILRIRSGTLPVPYDRIVIGNPELAVQGPRQLGGEEGGDEDVPPPPGKPRSPREKTELVLATGEMPSPGARQTLRLPTLDRFRDKREVQRLVKPPRPSSRRPKRDEPPATPPESPPSAPTATGAVGDAGPGSAKRVVLIVGEQQSKTKSRGMGRARSATFGAFHDGLDALDSVLEQPHEIIVLNGLVVEGDPCASFFPTKLANLDAYHAWYYRRGARARRRKLMVAAARYQRSWFALLESEQKSHEQFQLAVAHSGLLPPADNALAGIAAAAAVNNCIWPEGAVHGLDVRKLKHTWEDACGFVSTITALMDVMLG